MPMVLLPERGGHMQADHDAEKDLQGRAEEEVHGVAQLRGLADDRGP